MGGAGPCRRECAHFIAYLISFKKMGNQTHSKRDGSQRKELVSMTTGGAHTSSQREAWTGAEVLTASPQACWQVRPCFDQSPSTSLKSWSEQGPYTLLLTDRDDLPISPGFYYCKGMSEFS